ncbi:MAG: acyl carrier protein [Candidatus Thorarchaeota archaeon]
MSAKLNEILEKTFQLQPQQITDNISQETLESWDSMSHLILITELEENFKIQFSDDQIISLKSVADIKKILKENGVVLD